MKEVNLEKAIELLENKAELAMEDLNKDLVHAMKWGSHEDAYMYNVQIKFLRKQLYKDRSVEAVKAEIADAIYRMVETSISQSVLSARCDQLKLAALKDLAGSLYRYTE